MTQEVHIPPEVLEYLKAHFPNVMPVFGTSIETIAFQQGQQALIYHLAYLVEKQSENLMKG